MKKTIILIIVIILSFSINSYAETRNMLQSVEYSAKDGADTVTLRVNSYKGYKIIRISEPDRIVINLPNTFFDDKQQIINLDSNVVKTVRYAQYDKNTARVVLDVIGQPAFSTVEKPGQLDIIVQNPQDKNQNPQNKSSDSTSRSISDGSSRRIRYMLTVDGEQIKTDVPPVVFDNIMLVPVRAVFEKLGAAVDWNITDEIMTIAYNDNKIILKNKDNNIKLNGNTIKLDAPPRLVGNRMMVPLDFIRENLKLVTNVSTNEKIVTISSRNTLKNVEFIRGSGREQIAISLKDSSSYSIMRLTGPDRIVIDFPNTIFEGKLKESNVKGSLVKTLRYAQYGENTARVVLDVSGQPQYNAEVKQGQLVVSLENSSYRNIVYNNSGDRVHFILNKAKLTDGGEELMMLFEGQYDETGKRYKITFPSSQANLGSGVMKINDGVLDSVEIINNKDSQNTSIVFNAKDRFVYEVFTRAEVNNTAITILKPAAESDRLVVIDAGHGGTEPGATYGDLKEKNLNLDIALRLNNLLKSKNIKTYMIREDDSNVGLYERGYIANDMNATLFLSIHNNAIGDPGFGGTMTLYYPQDPDDGSFNGMKFASIIQQKLLNKLKTIDRKIVQRPNLVVLKTTVMPSVLAEVAYITNKTDRNNLLKDSFRQNAASALCDAVIQALREIKQP